MNNQPHILLALEGSTRTAGAALFTGDTCRAEASTGPGMGWEAVLFECIEQVLSEAGCAIAEVDGVAAGRGPGQYTGMRLTLGAALGLALPRKLPVYTLSSAEALARAVGSETGAERIGVAGDARREQAWWGVFVRQDERFLPSGPWQVEDWARLNAAHSDADVWVTSEWDRLKARIDDATGWIRESRIPTARMVGDAARARMAVGLPGEPAEPLYTHGAV